MSTVVTYGEFVVGTAVDSFAIGQEIPDKADSSMKHMNET